MNAMPHVQEVTGIIWVVLCMVGIPTVMGERHLALLEHVMKKLRLSLCYVIFSRAVTSLLLYGWVQIAVL